MNITEPETNSNFEARKEAQIANPKVNEASSKHQVPGLAVCVREG